MSSDDSAVERISSFISGNKRGIIIGAAAAALAVGGVAYYVASSRVGGGAGDEESLGGAKKKDKKKKKHKRSVKDKDGPILEEKKPKEAEESDDGQSTTHAHSALASARAHRSLADVFFLCALEQPLTEEQIQVLETGVSAPLELFCLFRPFQRKHRNASRSRPR
jgi:import receptor subunit TOM70